MEKDKFWSLRSRVVNNWRMMGLTEVYFWHYTITKVGPPLVGRR